MDMKKYIVLVTHIFDTNLKAENIVEACRKTKGKYERREGTFRKPFGYTGGYFKGEDNAANDNKRKAN